MQRRTLVLMPAALALAACGFQLRQQPFTGKISPIGFGVLSESQLLERIATVSAPQAEAMQPTTTQGLALPPEAP